MGRMVELEVFIAVVEMGSFSKAANLLGISRSYASKLIHQLEDRLGVQLLNRSTRSVVPTDTGMAFFENCAPLLDGLSEAEARVMEERAEPRGILRMSAPITFGLKFVAPVVNQFVNQYPEIRIQIDYSDTFVDLLEGRFDLAIRGGLLPDSNFRSRKLAPLESVVVASPAYLARRPTPLKPEDLVDHDCLLYMHGRVRNSWKFTLHSGESVSVKVSGPLVANNGHALALATAAGRGIVCLPLFAVAEFIEAGKLVPLLEDWTPVPSGGLWAVYAHTSHIPLRARLFVKALADALTPLPWQLSQAGCTAAKGH